MAFSPSNLFDNIQKWASGLVASLDNPKIRSMPENRKLILGIFSNADALSTGYGTNKTNIPDLSTKEDFKLLQSIYTSAQKLKDNTQGLNITLSSGNTLYQAIEQISKQSLKLMASSEAGVGLNAFIKKQENLNPETKLFQTEGTNIKGDPNLKIKVINRAEARTGRYYSGTGTVELTTSAFNENEDPSTTIIHELGHRLDFIAKNNLAFSEYLNIHEPFVNKYSEYETNVVNFMNTLGGRSPEEIQDYAKYYANSSEIFARNFTKWVKLGTTGNPNFDKTYNYLQEKGFISEREKKALKEDLENYVFKPIYSDLEKLGKPFKEPIVLNRVHDYDEQDLEKFLTKSASNSYISELERTFGSTKPTQAINLNPENKLFLNELNIKVRKTKNGLRILQSKLPLTGKLLEQFLGNLPRMATGGYLSNGTYRVSEYGTEFILNSNTVQNLETALGVGSGGLTQELVANFYRENPSIRKPLASAKKASFPTGFSNLQANYVPVPNTPENRLLADLGAGPVPDSEGVMSLAGGRGGRPKKPFDWGTVPEDVKLAIDLKSGTLTGKSKVSSITDFSDKGFTEYKVAIDKATKGTERYSIYVDDLTKVVRSAAGQKDWLESNKPNVRQKAADVKLAEFKERQVQQYAQAEKDYPNAFKIIRGQDPGFLNAENKRLTIVKDTATGASRLNFQYTDESGVINKATVTVDQYGRALQNTSRIFQTFAQSMTRNIAEAFKWSIAIGLVYAPLQKFQQLVGDMVTNQAKLADIGITLNMTQQQTNQIFDAAAEVANKTGESINGVLQGYNQAYRATANAGSQTERYAQTNQLLTDSLILAKLSTLDQASATDVLTAALTQSGMGMDQGQKLIEKWIAVSKAAATDVATLAQTFAIAGEAAQNAGIDLDQLNGITATLSKAFTLSPTETGNAVRALVSGFTTPTTAKLLGTYGISTTTGKDEARGTSDIVQQIYEGLQNGSITEDDLKRISNTAGGGLRRGPQIAAVVKNWGLVNAATQVSRNAAGNVEQAMGLEMEIVSTKVTQLGNAFLSLAQILGTKGGILTLLADLASVANVVLTTVTGLVGILGTAAPVLAVVGGLALGTKGTPAVGNFFGSLGMSISQSALGIFNPGYKQVNAANDLAAQANLPFGQQPKMQPTPFSTSLATRAGSWMSKNGATMAGVLGIAGMEATQGGLGSAAIVGGAGLAAGLLSGFNPIVTLLATTIVESIVSGIREAKASIGKETFGLVIPKPEKEGSTPGVSKLATMAGRGSEDLGAGLAQGLSTGYGAVSGVHSLLGMIFQGSPLGNALFSKSLGTMNTTTAAGMLAGTVGGFTKEQVMAEIEAENKKAGLIPQDTNTPTGRLVTSLMNKGATATAQVSAEQFLTTRLQGGTGVSKIGITEYRNQLQTIQRFASVIPQLLAPVSDSFSKIDASITDSSSAYAYFGDLIARSTPDQLTALEQLKEDWTAINNAIQKAKDIGLSEAVILPGVGTEPDKTMTQVEAQKALTDAQTNLINAIKDQYIRGIIQTTTIPGTNTLNNITLETFKNIVVPEIQRIENERLAVMKPEEVIAQKDQWANSQFIATFANATQRQTGIPEDILSQAMQTLSAKNLLPQVSFAGPGINANRDLTLAQFRSVEQQADVLGKVFSKQFGYVIKPDTEGTVQVLKDGQILSHADQNMVALILNEINENQKKQLEGIYNLPEGAGFMVPYQAAKLAPTSSTLQDYFDPTKYNQITGEKIIPGAKTNYGSGENIIRPSGNVYTDQYGNLIPMPTGEVPGKSTYPTSYGSGENIIRPPGTYPKATGGVHGRYDLNAYGGVGNNPYGPPIPDTLKMPASNIKINLNINQTTQLVMDGKILAIQLMQYIRDMFVRQDITSSVLQVNIM